MNPTTPTHSAPFDGRILATKVAVRCGSRGSDRHLPEARSDGPRDSNGSEEKTSNVSLPGMWCPGSGWTAKGIRARNNPCCGSIRHCDESRSETARTSLEAASKPRTTRSLREIGEEGPSGVSWRITRLHPDRFVRCESTPSIPPPDADEPAPRSDARETPTLESLVAARPPHPPPSPIEPRRPRPPVRRAPVAVR